MKKTVYHTGDTVQCHQIAMAIASACEKRDAWIDQNRSHIGEVQEEDLIISRIYPDNSQVIATIKYTYYPTEE
jgi:hypothetical protein